MFFITMYYVFWYTFNNSEVVEVGQTSCFILSRGHESDQIAWKDYIEHGLKNNTRSTRFFNPTKSVR